MASTAYAQHQQTGNEVDVENKLPASVAPNTAIQVFADKILAEVAAAALSETGAGCGIALEDFRMFAVTAVIALSPADGSRMRWDGKIDNPGKCERIVQRGWIKPRWTKLPVALSGGSSANSRPLAGDRLSTCPFRRTPWKLSISRSTGWPSLDADQNKEISPA
jgi:hypothetical protein